MLQEFHFEFISTGRELTRNVQYFSWASPVSFIVASREICFVVYLMINSLGLWFLVQSQLQISPSGILPPLRWSFPFSKTCCQLLVSPYPACTTCICHHFSCLAMHHPCNDTDIFLASRQISSTTVTKRRIIGLVWFILPLAKCVVLLYKLCELLYKSHE